MSIKLNSSSGSITLAPEDGSGDVSVTIPRAGVIPTKSTIDALGIAATSVTGAQASAITANTAKTGITSSQASAITANTAKVTNSTSASDLTSGTLADARFPATLPAISGANLTNLPAGGATSINGLTDVDTSTAAPTDGQVLAWDNTASKWEPTASASSESFAYTATSGQTAFTGADTNSATLSYTVGKIHVFLNGILLDAADYTATNGTLITLAVGATTGDTLQVVAYGVLVSAGGGGGGGAWNKISTTAITSTTAEVEYTLSGYTVYKIIYHGVNFGANESGLGIKMTLGASGTYSETLKWQQWRMGGMNSASTVSGYGGTGSLMGFWGGFKVLSTNGNTSGEITIFNTAGQPVIRVHDQNVDDYGGVGIGTTTAVAGFETPTATGTIGKFKLLAGTTTESFEQGTFILYGLTT
jgi:hypothetical protein